MSVELEVQLSASLDQSSLDSSCDDIRDSFDDLGEDLSSGLEKSFSSKSKSMGKTLESTLGDSILDGVSNGLDSLGDIWDKAWDSLASIAKKALSSALGGLTFSSLGSLFGLSNSSGSGTSWLASALGLGSSASAASSGGLGSWLSPLFGGAAAEGAGGITALGDLAGMEGFGGLEALGDLGLEGILGGEVAAEGAGGVFGLSSGLTVAGAIAAPLAVAEIMSALGLMEGTSPLQALFGESEGHTQESALSTINADLSYLAQASQVVQESLTSATGSAQNFALTILTDMSKASLEMGRLAERAGLSDEELDALVDSLDPANAKLIEASECLGLVNEKIDSMDDVLEKGADSFCGLNTAGSELEDMLLSLANSLGISGAAGDTLTSSIQSLIQQWEDGQISADTLSSSLKTAFAQALAQLASDAVTTADSMRDLAESIESIPTTWSSEVSVTYTKNGDVPSLDFQHGGGLLMHQGGWLGGLPRYHGGAQVSALFADEVPIIAQRGEFIVRRDSVNAATLPLLKALNQAGAAGSGQASQTNLHLEIHGNLLGDESALEDLARLMEGKLRDLDQGRYGA